MEPAMLPPIHLLLVEPDPPTQEEMQTILEAEGYHVTLATTVAGAQGHLSHLAFDLIITELYFRRRQDRFRVAGLLRVQADPTPVGILTRFPVTASEIQSRGFAWCLSKPVEHNALLAQVAASLSLDYSPAQCQQQAACWPSYREQARLEQLRQEQTAWNTEIELLDGDTTWGSDARSTVRCDLCQTSLDAAEAYFSRYTSEAICQKCHYFEEAEQKESEGVRKGYPTPFGAGMQATSDAYSAPSGPFLHFNDLRSTQDCH